MRPPDPELIQIEVAAFDSLKGDFFDALDNPEELTHRTPLDALRHLLEVEPEAQRSLRVDVWNRQVVPATWKASVATQIVGLLIEEFDESESGFGSLYDATKLTDEADAAVTASARQLVDLFLTKVKVWRCEKTAELHLSRAAVREIYKREGLDEQC